MPRVGDVATGAVFACTILALYLRPFGAKDWQVDLSGAYQAVHPPSTTSVCPVM